MSLQLAHLQGMMQELGPNCPEIDAIIQSEEASWAIQFSDDTVVLMEWSEEPPCLMLSAALGQADEKRRLEVYRRLLAYNLEWRSSGGMRAALGGPEGEAVLLREAYGSQIDAIGLPRLLQEFAQQARQWSRFVGPVPEHSSGLPPGGSELLA